MPVKLKVLLTFIGSMGGLSLAMHQTSHSSPLRNIERVSVKL